MQVQIPTWPAHAFNKSSIKFALPPLRDIAGFTSHKGGSKSLEQPPAPTSPDIFTFQIWPSPLATLCQFLHSCPGTLFSWLAASLTTRTIFEETDISLSQKPICISTQTGFFCTDQPSVSVGNRFFINKYGLWMRKCSREMGSMNTKPTHFL